MVLKSIFYSRTECELYAEIIENYVHDKIDKYGLFTVGDMLDLENDFNSRINEIKYSDHAYGWTTKEDMTTFVKCCKIKSDYNNHSFTVYCIELSKPKKLKEPKEFKSES